MKLNVETGKIVSVAISAGLNSAFERLFRSAEADLESVQPDVDTGIRVVVFGCMWIEGLCNEYIPEILAATDIAQEAAAAVWNGLERASPLRKLTTIAAFDRESRGTSSDWPESMARVFRIRNSLMHFKDEETQVAGPVTLEEFAGYLADMGSLPEAQLIVELKPPNIQQLARTIREAAAGAHAIFRQHRPGDERAL